MGLVTNFPTPPSTSAAAAQRRTNMRRIKRSPVVLLLLAITTTCLILSTIILSVSSASYCRRTVDHRLHPRHRLRVASSSSSSWAAIRSTRENSAAFIFSLLKNKRRKNSSIISDNEPKQQEPGILPSDNVRTNGDNNGNNLMMKNGMSPKEVKDGQQRNNYYNLGDNTNGQQQQQQQQQQLEIHQLLDMDLVEDEPYATIVHPIHNAYNKLSVKSAAIEEESSSSLSSSSSSSESEGNSLDSMEGNNGNVNYIRALNNESPTKKDDGYPLNDADNDVVDKMEHLREEEITMAINDKIEEAIIHNDSENDDGWMWAKRNARSIDEGIRFKSQLRQGLEEQTKLHRKKLLSNLLEGTTTALELETQKIKNVTSRFRWPRFGRGDNKDSESEGEESTGTTSDSKSPNTYEETAVKVNSNTISSSDNNNHGIETTKDHNPNNNTVGKFGARTITGLIMAVAEEVEGLEVEVDADASTPLREKTVHSINIYFSRLGFRQLRMGGPVDEVFSELNSTSSLNISEKITLARNFFNVGNQPTTADEAFDTMDVDKSGTLDEEELAQALKMAVVIGGNKFGTRSKEALTKMASRLVRLYDTDGDGVVDREEYQAMVQDMASVRDARLRDETELDGMEGNDGGEKKKRRGWFSSVFGGGGGGDEKTEDVSSSENNSTITTMDGENFIDVTENEEFWGSLDRGEGSIVLEDLKLDLRRFVFGAIPGVKRILPGGPLILKPFTATITASFNQEDIMESLLFDLGLRLLISKALSRRVRGIRDLLDGAVFYGRAWKLFEQNSPQVEVAKLEDVHFDKRNRLIITGRVKITDSLGYKHEPIEQGFKLRTKIGTRANGQIIGLLQPEIAIFAECPRELEKTVRTQCKEWFGYTIPTFKPVYAYIPLVSPLKKNDKMDGFNMGEDNQMKSIEIKNGKLRLSFCAFLRPGRFLGNHYLAYTLPNRTIILTLDKCLEAMRIARRNKRLAERAAREVLQLAAARGNGIDNDNDKNEIATQSNSRGKPISISPEGKVRIRRLEKELKATIKEDLIIREIEDSAKESPKSFIRRFVEGYSGAIREELDLEMNDRLSSSISDFFGSQDREGDDNVKEL